MKRTLCLSTLAGTLVAAVLLPSLVSQNDAHAAPIYRAMNGRYYYGGGYAQDYDGNFGPAYSPYGYTYVAPRAYITPSYRDYGFGNGYGIGGTYNGYIDRGESGSRFYGQPYRPMYSPYGRGSYIRFGF